MLAQQAWGFSSAAKIGRGTNIFALCAPCELRSVKPVKAWALGNFRREIRSFQFESSELDRVRHSGLHRLGDISILWQSVWMMFQVLSGSAQDGSVTNLR